MRSFLVTAILLLLFSGAVFGQAQACQMTVDQAPAIENLKLGMTPAEVKLALGPPDAVPTPVKTGSAIYYPRRPGERFRRERKYDVGVETYTATPGTAAPKEVDQC